MPKILLTSLLVFISVLVFGQRWQFAAGPGAVVYKGDLLDWHLAPNAAQLKKMSPSVNFQVRYQEKNGSTLEQNLVQTNIDLNAF